MVDRSTPCPGIPTKFICDVATIRINRPSYRCHSLQGQPLVTSMVSPARVANGCCKSYQTYAKIEPVFGLARYFAWSHVIDSVMYISHHSIQFFPHQPTAAPTQSQIKIWNTIQAKVTSIVNSYIGKGTIHGPPYSAGRCIASKKLAHSFGPKPTDAPHIISSSPVLKYAPWVSPCCWGRLCEEYACRFA